MINSCIAHTCNLSTYAQFLSTLQRAYQAPGLITVCIVVTRCVNVRQILT